MLDYVRALDWVPRPVRHKEQALAEAYTTIERQQGRPATDEEVAAWLGLDLGTFDDWLIQVRGVSVEPGEAAGACPRGACLHRLGAVGG